MLDEVGMTKELQGVVDLRNEIVHSGLSRMPHSELWKAYEEIHDLFREYLLRLLGFQGHYLPAQAASAPRSTDRLASKSTGIGATTTTNIGY